LAEAASSLAALLTRLNVGDLAAGSLNLDFDKEERLVGIEILSASRVLPREVIDRAERL
jgi:uncharacterized protein YuzE